MKYACLCYMLANRKQGALYIGVTTNIIQRISQHQEKTFKGFTATYDINKLVWYEVFDDVMSAIAHEKKMKKWSRARKIVLLETANRDWFDLSHQIVG